MAMYVVERWYHVKQLLSSTLEATAGELCCGLVVGCELV